MSDKDAHIDRLYAQARQRRLRTIVDELRIRLRPFSRDMDPEIFEEEILEMAERRLREDERGLRPGRLSRLTPV